jgi:hypothetical protein
MAEMSNDKKMTIHWAIKNPPAIGTGDFLSSGLDYLPPVDDIELGFVALSFFRYTLLPALLR